MLAYLIKRMTIKNQKQQVLQIEKVCRHPDCSLPLQFYGIQDGYRIYVCWNNHFQLCQK